MYSKKNEHVSVDESKLEIEHVLPQKWREVDYPLPVTPHKEATRRFEEERKRKIHSFGNLTLLVSALNKDISNSRFSEKRGKIAEQSALRLNVYFQRITDNETWDTQAIESRGRGNRSHPPAVRLPASWGCWAAMSPSERRRP